MKLLKTNKYTGFTIVELLIVVVVIAILSAITIVAYNGITNQARDAVVLESLATARDAVAIASIDGGADCPAIATLRLDPTNPAFARGISNLIYFRGTVDTGGSCGYAVLIQSVSGNRFYVSSLNGTPRTYTGPWHESGNFAMSNHLSSELGVTSYVTSRLIQP